MFNATLIITVLYGLALLGSAVGKLQKSDQMVESMAKVGVRRDQMTYLGIILFVGAAGLLVGLKFAPIGIAASAGLALYFSGAVAAHVKHQDKNFAAALVFALVAVLVLVLRILSA